jgi:hypothetical protein
MGQALFKTVRLLRSIIIIIVGRWKVDGPKRRRDMDDVVSKHTNQ